MELFHANKQWSTRPADQRFASLQELFDQTLAYAKIAGEKLMSVAELRAEAVDGDVRIVGKRSNPAMLTHWSFGQLANKIGAPASYLRDLPATLACQNLNHGLAKLSGEDELNKAKLLFHANGQLMQSSEGMLQL